MVDVVIHKDALEKSKFHSTIIEKVRQEMVKSPSETRPPPSGKKWQEIVDCGGGRYAVSCRWVSDKVMMTLVRKTPKKHGIGKRRIIKNQYEI